MDKSPRTGFLSRGEKPRGTIDIGTEERLAWPGKPEQSRRVHDGIDRRQR
jgi:hypothetical protein